METSSISAIVQAANGRLAQFLRSKEEEEMLLQIGKRRPKELKEQRRTRGSRARWSAEPDFKVPTCMVDRPRTSTGATSFHFSYISISKQAFPTVGGKPIEGAMGKVRNAALDHAKYIERDGAAEVTSLAHANYIERPEAIENLGPSALIEEAIERQIASVVNETPTDEEAQLLGLRDVIPDGIPSVFSNISNDPFERQEYWRAVERCERVPRMHQLILDPEVSPRWWAALETASHLDPEFKNHALTVQEQYRQHMAAPVPEGEARKPFKPAPLPVNAERAGKLLQQAMHMPGFDPALPPVEFKSGRGGRIQIRFVAELPHEVTPEDRALIVQNFCDRLASLETRIDPDGTERKVGMMYTAVIHAPDAHNDSRNYHLHIVAHDRPARYLEDEGQWDFEVQEHYHVKGMDRVRHPFRQNKIGEVSQHESRTGKENSGKDFIPAMRADFARITNAVLKARGIERRYDPRKYTEMGIDRTPTEHLGTKAAALEAIGVPTTVGQLNAIAIWSDAEREIERQAKQREKALKERQAFLKDLATRATAAEADHENLSLLRKLIAERNTLIETLAEDRRMIMAFDHMEAKAKSRAIRTRQTCLQFLADIENGKADATTKVMKFAIQARWKDAQEHINKIDEALKPHRDALAEAARSVESRERRLIVLDKSLIPVQMSLEREIKAAGLATSKQPAARPEKTQAGPVLPQDMPAKVDVPAPANDTTHAAAPDAKPSKEAAPASSAKPEVSPTPTPAIKDDAKKPAGPELDPTPAAEPKASPQPVRIEGLPITKGTIGPAADEPTPGTEADQTIVPEGLQPLRPDPVPQKAPVTPETVIEDIEEASQEPAERADAPPGPVQSGSPRLPSEPAQSDQSAKPSDPGNDASTPAEETVAAAVPEEPKIDLRRKSQEPALFDLPVQEPPAKPGTAWAEYKDWDDLMRRIISDRIPVRAEQLKDGSLRYSVPALNEEERALLQARRFAHRTGGRLAAIHEKQVHEIKRLARWIAQWGQDPELLIITGRTMKLGDVPKAVRTLMRHWGRHPEVLAAIRSEAARRIEVSKAEENARTEIVERDDLPAGFTRAELLAQAAEKYPAPDQVYTPQVSEFTRLLRELAPKEKLQAAADKIHESADAREDVNRHTVDLATAYSQYVEGVDMRAAYRERGGKGGRG